MFEMIDYFFFCKWKAGWRRPKRVMAGAFKKCMMLCCTSKIVSVCCLLNWIEFWSLLF